MTKNADISNSQDKPNRKSDIIWLLKGFIYPCWSREFYKKAAEKKVSIAILFFFIFAFVQTTVSAIRLVNAMNGVGDKIELAFELGEFPAIVIEDGVATADELESHIFSNNSDLIAIDTTGDIQEIDTDTYSRGLLLTSTEIHFVAGNSYRKFQLADVHEYFGNPIVINETQTLDLWNTVSRKIKQLIIAGTSIWNIFVRPLHIVLIGLLIWGIISVKRKNTDFNLILIIGIYANVPTLYLSFILKKIGAPFLGLYTILLIVIWIVALRVVIKVKDDNSDMADSKVTPISEPT